MSINVREIAKRAGVSTATVSRVLNDSPRVSEETKARVREIIAESGYNRVQPKEPPKTVCIVLSDDTERSPHKHPTVYTILNNIKLRLSELGISNRLYMLNVTDESIDALLLLKVDGYIFLRTSRTQEDLIIPRLLSKEHPKPILMVNRRIDLKEIGHVEISHVNIDDYAAEFKATEHLIKNGCRRIAFVNGDESLRNSVLRRNGYLGAMKHHALEVNSQLMLAGKYTENFGRQAAKQLLELPRHLRPDGIVTSSDVIALGIEKELLHQEVAIPGDVQLIGFGDVEFDRYISPPLSTMTIPAEEMGTQAANGISFLMSDPFMQAIKIYMRSELVIRGTTLPEARLGTERGNRK